MVKLDDYLTTMNVHLPTLQKDLVLLAKVSRTYALAAPDLVRLLRNATTTAHTVTDEGDAAARRSSTTSPGWARPRPGC